MIEKIKSVISKKYKLSDKKGIFISTFGHNGELLISNGVIVTNKTINETIETLRLGIFSKKEENTKAIVIDIITDIFQETNMQKLIKLDMKKYGLFISNIEKTKSGVILPNTVGVADSKHALFVLKKKYPELNGNVLVWIFTTDRIIV